MVAFSRRKFLSFCAFVGTWLFLFGCGRKKHSEDGGRLSSDLTSAVPGDSISLWSHEPSDEKSYYLVDSKNRTVDLASSGSKWQIPKIQSGIYLIQGERPLVVKDPSRQAPIVVLYPSNTNAAYNTFGGASMYYGEGGDYNTRARVVDLSRPTKGYDMFCEGFIRWVDALPPKERAQFRFIADSDMDDYAEIATAKVLVVIGHSEYWSRKGRENFDRFVEGGKHAAVLSGNSMWWQVRYENNGQSLVCYRVAAEDPIRNPKLKSVSWFDRKLDYSIIHSIGADFHGGGYGDHVDRGWDGYKITSENSPLLVGTGLGRGEVVGLVTKEYDGAPVRGFDRSGFPLLNEQKLGFAKTELIGFDLGVRNGKQTVGTFMAFQKTPRSGYVVNTGSTNWCAMNGMGSATSHGRRITKITENIIFKLLEGAQIFSKN